MSIMSFTLLFSDIFVYVLVVSLIGFLLWARTKENMRAAWMHIVSNKVAVVALIILLSYITLGFLDTIHVKVQERGVSSKIAPTKVKSLLDIMLGGVDTRYEKTYSAPFSNHLFVKENIIKDDGTVKRGYPKLKYGGQLIEGESSKAFILFSYLIANSLKALLVVLLLAVMVVGFKSLKTKSSPRHVLSQLWRNQTPFPWKLSLFTLFIVLSILFSAFEISTIFHILGTDKIGQDVFYQSIKSIRTGLIIGTITTLIMLPFAVLFGIMAGYFGGKSDDVIQYLYTTISSIPSVLLIAASILSLQVYISNHPEYFTSLEDRADVRLLALCLVLGLTSWTSLCRLIRAETLKIREMDYIKAAIAIGVGRVKIILKHILPNLLHIILITVVIDFSMLVLAEAVLSYVGVGVSPTTHSWGNMINSARLELAREPIVWWPILSAFIFMFVLVLSANLFSDAIRDAFDPKKHNIG